MSNFDPPSVKPRAAPDFTDSSGCAKWLQSLPLINVGPSHVRLLAQLDELNACNIAPAERLKILELLREPVSFVQKEHSKKFSSRPAPLTKPEREILHSVQALWDALSYGYQHCLKAVAGGASATSAALIGQRVLWCTGQKMVAYYQAYQDVSEREWKLLHSVYAFVEDRGVAGGEVAHPAHKGRQTTCTETYAQVLLIDLANPGKLTPRQIELISLWLERWTPKVSIGRTPAAAGDGVAPLVIDLSSAAGASRRMPEGDTTRVLDIHELGSSVRKRVGLLRKGETPAALGLGEDVTAPLAESLLTMLYRRWCEDKQSRAHPRRSANRPAHSCSGSGWRTRRPFFSARSSGSRSRWNSNCASASRSSPGFPKGPRSGRSAPTPRLSNTPRRSCCRRSPPSRLRKHWLSRRDGSSRIERSRCSRSAPASCDLRRSSIAAPISSASRSRQPKARRSRAILCQIFHIPASVDPVFMLLS